MAIQKVTDIGVHPEGSESINEGTKISAIPEAVKGAVAGLTLLAASMTVPGKATAEEIQVALNGNEGVAELIAEQDKFTLPTEISFSNSAGENFVVSGDQEALFAAWSLQQTFSTIPAPFKSQVEQDWLELSTSDMQTVLSIHAGTVDLEGDTQAHEFYHTMLRSFLELGREYYIQNAPISDPEGWEGYSPAEISEDWDDFMDKYSEGTRNTDLDYRVIGNPDFFNGISIFFPNHPVTAEIQKELDIIAGREQIAEGREQISRIEEGIRQEELLQARYRAITAAANKLSETLEGAIEGMVTN